MLGRGRRGEVVRLILLGHIDLNVSGDGGKLLHSLLVLEVGVIPQNTA